jgi:hypothetical protein
MGWIGNLIPEHLTEEMYNFECKKLREEVGHDEGWTEHRLKG